MRRNFIAALFALVATRFAAAQTKVAEAQIARPTYPDDRLAALLANGSPAYVRLGSGLVLTLPATGTGGPPTLDVLQQGGSTPAVFESGAATGATVTLPDVPCVSLPVAIYRNGLRQDASDGITRNGAVLTFARPLTGERVVVDYWKAC